MASTCNFKEILLPKLRSTQPILGFISILGKMLGQRKLKKGELFIQGESEHFLKLTKAHIP